MYINTHEPNKVWQQIATLKRIKEGAGTFHSMIGNVSRALHASRHVAARCHESRVVLAREEHLERVLTNAWERKNIETEAPIED